LEGQWEDPVLAGAELMPCVLWGIGCISLAGPATAAEVIRDFREALSLQIRGAGSGSDCDDKHSADKGQPRVDLYRLVRIDDQAACRLAGEDQVVAHLPDSSWGCHEIEEMCRQRDDAELRCNRARESLVSFMESLDLGEASQPSPHNDESRPVVRGIPTAQTQQMYNMLRQENKSLRYKLNQSEIIRKELTETAEMLRREFMLLVSEIMPRGAQQNQQQVAAAASMPAAHISSPSIASPGAGPFIGTASASAGAGPIIGKATASSSGPAIVAPLSLNLEGVARQQHDAREAWSQIPLASLSDDRRSSESDTESQDNLTPGDSSRAANRDPELVRPGVPVRPSPVPSLGISGWR
jgi:hypothetical protein